MPPRRGRTGVRATLHHRSATANATLTLYTIHQLPTTLALRLTAPLRHLLSRVEVKEEPSCSAAAPMENMHK
eukprot:scaffold120274_cov33-Tisochrysis_lutea.AAC.1